MFSRLSKLIHLYDNFDIEPFNSGIESLGSSDTQWWLIHVPLSLQMSKDNFSSLFTKTPLRLNSYAFAILPTHGMKYKLKDKKHLL